MIGNDCNKENVSPENDKRVAYDNSEELFHGSDNARSSGANTVVIWTHAKQFVMLHS